MLYQNKGSGTYAIDAYREGMANKAINVLGAGRSILCKSADHLTSAELCCETIARLTADNSKCGNGLEASYLGPAIDKLRAGYGHHTAQAAHATGSTCAQTLAAAVG